MAQSSASSIKKVITIPYKIKRSPTDILKALSGTVSNTFNRPKYSLIDDTILYPQTLIMMKQLELSKISGIKAARFMIEKYPQAFMKDDCVPHVPAFFPNKEFTEKELKYPNENLIYSLIEWGKFKKAYEIYAKCKDQNIIVSEACKLVLLDFLCINNSEDLPPKLFPEELFYSRGEQRLRISAKMMLPESNWNDKGEANLLFEDLSVKTAEAYCSMIKGMANSNEIQKSFLLYQEMKSKSLNPDLSTLNKLIRLIGYKQTSFIEKKNEMIATLKEMKSYGIKPNIKTFNNSLFIIYNHGTDKTASELALDILKEMELVKIEPCLATWAYIISILYENSDPKSYGVLNQIITELEKNSKEGIEPRDEDDSLFFVLALQKSIVAENNLDLFKRVHKILTQHDNIKFLNDYKLLSQYFDNYFNGLMNYDIPENVMAEWRNLTPFVFPKSKYLVDRMAKYINEYDYFDFLPDIWSDFLAVYTKNKIDDVSKIIKLFLQTMAKYDTNDQLFENFVKISNTIISMFGYVPKLLKIYKQDEETKINEMTTREISYKWDSNMLNDYFSIQLKAKDFRKIDSELDKFIQNEKLIEGVELSETCILDIIKLYYENKQVNMAMKIFEYQIRNKKLSRDISSQITKFNTSDFITQEEKSLLKEIISTKQST